MFGEEEGTALHLGFPRVFCLAMRGQGLHKPGVHKPPHGASVYVIDGYRGGVESGDGILAVED